MRNTLFGLLSVVVLAAALTVGLVPTPVAEAQFASNNRSVKLRSTAAGNVATPASGYVSVFLDSTYGSLSFKDSAGLVGGVAGKVAVTTLAADTTLTDAHIGELIIYDGAASQTLTLPTITASNIGMVFDIVGLDADDVSVACASADEIINAASAAEGADDNDTVVFSTVGARAKFIAISATTWLMTEAEGTVTHS